MKGIVKYGSGDSSIVNEAGLRSATDIGTGSGAALSGSGHTFDAEKGMLTGLSGALYLGEMPSYITMGMIGQWSIDVEPAWLASPLVNDQGKGFDPTSNEYLVSHGDSAVGLSAPYGHYRITPVGEFGVVADNTTTQVIPRISTLPQDGKEFVTITFGNRGNQVDMYIDGRHMQTFSRVFTQELCRYWYLGSLMTTGTGLEQHYVRNFVASTNPVEVGQGPRIGWYGDSFVIQSATDAVDAGLVAPGYDAKGGHSLAGYMLRKHNLRPAQAFHGTSGGQVSQTAGTQILTGRPALLNSAYEYVIHLAGVNDANTGTLPADFETSIQDDIDTILAAGSGTKKIIIVATPSVYPVTGTQANSGVVDSINTIKAGLPAVWDAANPSDTGRVLYCDIFNPLGGHDPISKYFVAMDNGLLNESHLTGAGQKVMGEAIGATVTQALG